MKKEIINVIKGHKKEIIVGSLTFICGIIAGKAIDELFYDFGKGTGDVYLDYDDDTKKINMYFSHVFHKLIRKDVKMQFKDLDNFKRLIDGGNEFIDEIKEFENKKTN